MRPVERLVPRFSASSQSARMRSSSSATILAMLLAFGIGPPGLAASMGGIGRGGDAGSERGRLSHLCYRLSVDQRCEVSARATVQYCILAPEPVTTAVSLWHLLDVATSILARRRDS